MRNQAGCYLIVHHHSITLSKNERLVNLDAAFSLLQLPSKSPTEADAAEADAAVVVPLLAVIAFPLSLSLALCMYAQSLKKKQRLFFLASSFMVSASFFFLQPLLSSAV